MMRRAERTVDSGIVNVPRALSVRHVRRELWRNAWLAFTPILPAAACQQRHYLKTDSRFMEGMVM
jgi:hypothetical protein